MTQALIVAIRDIIQPIPIHHIFDSHYVVQMLFENYSDEYEQARRNYETVEAFHFQISTEIKRLIVNNQPLVSEIGESYSYNIHHKPSQNKCWRKEL